MSFTEKLRETGSKALKSIEGFKKIVEESQITEEEVAETIGMMAMETEKGVEWDLEVFSGVMGKRDIKWDQVFELLDREELEIKTQKGVDVLTNLFHSLNVKFPLHLLFNEWKNQKTQTMLLSSLVFCPVEWINFANYDKILSTEEQSALRHPIQTNQAFNCLPLLKIMWKLQSEEKASKYLEQCINQAPESTLIGLTKLEKSKKLEERINLIICDFFKNPKPNNVFALKKLLRQDEDILMNSILEYYATEQNIHRVLQTSLQIEALDQMLQMKKYPFVIDLAICASATGGIDLNSWLHKRTDTEFVEECWKYFQLENGKMLRESATVMLEFLKINNHIFEDSDVQKLSDIEIQQTYFAREIEEKAIRLIDNLYTGEMTRQDLIDHLMILKVSRDPMERELYMCSITTFLEEASFFSKYPEGNLITAGHFLGMLISNNLLTQQLLDESQKLLLDILLLKDPGKMYIFAISAISKFLSKVNELNSFFMKLVSMPAIKQNSPELLQMIEQSLPTKIFSSINPDDELICDFQDEDPTESQQNKILFVVNNLSSSNIDSKFLELNDVLKQSNYRWFSRYMVQKRAAIEPNFHKVYLLLIEQFASTKLDNLMIHDSLCMVDNLLNTDTHNADKVKLKNLANWLGSLTLAKNKIFKHKHLALKFLLIEAYDYDMLNPIVPFVCKLLETSKNSKVFTPKNPWISAMLCLLKELYTIEQALNIKFEIEVLCKTLKVDLKEIQKSDVLRKPRKQKPKEQTPAITLSEPQTPKIDYSQATLSTLSAFISINPALSFIASISTLRRLICLAFERSFGDILSQAVERSVTIAVICTRELILKDFQMEPDEKKMQHAAHGMVRKLASSLAQLSSKDSLVIAMNNSLRALFSQNGYNEQKVTDQVIQMIVNENIELGIHLIEKNALEKAVYEIDDQLAPFLKKNKKIIHDQEYKNKIMNLPEYLRLKSNGLTNQQFMVYQDFTLCQPKEISQDKSVETFNQILQGIEKNFQVLGNQKLSEVPFSHEIKECVRQLPYLLPNSSSRDKLALGFCSKIVQMLYANANMELKRDVYSYMLREVCAQSSKVAKEVMQWLLFSDDERKYNAMVTLSLLKCGMIKLQDLDLQISKVLESGKQIHQYAHELINLCVTENLTVEQDWVNTLDAIQVKSSEPNLLREQLVYTFAEWVKLYQHANSDAVFSNFVVELSKYNIFQTDDATCLFFRVCTELSIDAWAKSYKTISPPVLSFQAIDAFSKLVVYILKFRLVTTSNAQEFFSKILSILVLILVSNHQTQKQKFNQKPFFRLFLSLCFDLNSANLLPTFIESLAVTYHSLQPKFVPGFTYSWVSLISHSLFMPVFLSEKQLWPCFIKLLVDLLSFLSPFLIPKMSDASRFLYKACLRIILVILHDFPDFLCEYYYPLCAVIPMNSLQLRNLILSAFPHSMRLPDPFSQDLKIELLPECKQTPVFNVESIHAVLLEFDVSESFDANLIAAKLKENLNLRLISAVCFMACHFDQDYKLFVFFANLLGLLDNEGKYLVVSNIVNHLRYPNSHTLYFSSLCLSLFLIKSPDNILQEIITRVLLERLIVNRPHPWGLLVTFIYLMKDPKYNFWSYEFTHCAPDIEKIFDSVARSLNRQ